MTGDPVPPRAAGTFSLEGRPAPALYVLAWLLSAVGLGLLFVAIQSPEPAGGLLLIAGLVVLGLGLVSAAGTQVVTRASRPPAAYRGPSPLIVFVLQLIFVNLLGAALFVVGLPNPQGSPAAFAVTGAVLLFGYVAVIWLFVVRTGALTWREMGVPLGLPITRIVSDAAFGALVMLVAFPIITALLVVLALLLQTSTPSVVPLPTAPTELLLTIMGAAILVPIGEELFFRGYSLTAWLRDLGPRSALIRSVIFFAVIHTLNVNVAPTADAAWEGARQALLLVLSLIPVAFVLGWLFLRRGLVAAIAAHATFNGIEILLLYLSQFAPTQPPT